MRELLIILILILVGIIFSKHELIRYHNYVKYSCDLDAVHDTVQYIIKFNKILPDGYKVYTTETLLFDSVYRKYLLWLFSRYIKQDLSSILEDYHSLLSRRNHKLWNTKKLTNIFGNCLKEDLFLLETMEHFLVECEKKDCIGRSHIYNKGTSPELDTLTDIGIMVYKLLLADAVAKNIAGHTNDWEVTHAKELIGKSQALTNP